MVVVVVVGGRIKSCQQDGGGNRSQKRKYLTTKHSRSPSSSSSSSVPVPASNTYGRDQTKVLGSARVVPRRWPSTAVRFQYDTIKVYKFVDFMIGIKLENLNLLLLWLRGDLYLVVRIDGRERK